MPETEPKFPLGQIVATPGALEALQAANVTPDSLLRRHVSGDWGEIEEADRNENELSVALL
jgi:hypothetical protein